MENKQEKSQEDMVKEAVEEAKKSAAEAKEAETDTDETTETSEKVENEEADETAKDTEKKSGKKLFGKKKDKKDEKIEELTDKLTRQMAAFDNFRKRTEKEKSGMFEMGAKSVVEKLLPVVDNFERGLASVPEDQKEDPFVAGVDKVYKQLLTVFDELGVKPIEAVGQPFDPNLHNAVMHVEDESLGENVVAAVFQAGFQCGEKVIRFAMVKVAN